MEEDWGGAYAAPGANQDKRAEETYTSAPGSTQDVTIYYELHGIGSTKLLLIPGLACGHSFWRPCIRALTDCNKKEEHASISEQEALSVVDEYRGILDDQGGLQLCTFDNRGVGSSSIPTQKSAYSTTIMAKDALALMDFLGWKQAHICGHSMGAMIGFKLAAMAPDRVLSLTLISITGGGFECLPKFGWRSFIIAYKFLRAKTLEQRILVDLETHYTQDFLSETVGGVPRKDLLFKEYVKNMEGGVQPKAGLNGHIHACWSHENKDSEIHRIRAAGFLVAVIHGKDDVIAQVRHARKLVRRLGSIARMLELPGGHLVTHQNAKEVLKVLVEVIHATASNMRPCEWNRHDPGMVYEDDTASCMPSLSKLISSCFCLLVFVSWLFMWFIV